MKGTVTKVLLRWSIMIYPFLHPRTPCIGCHGLTQEVRDEKCLSYIIRAGDSMDGCCINHISPDTLMSMLQVMKEVMVLLMRKVMMLLMKMQAKVMKAKV